MPSYSPLNAIGSGPVYLSSSTTPSSAANPAAEARRANEERYQQLLDLYTGLRERTMAGVSDLGGAERSRIERSQAQASAAARANAAARGLSGTTVPDVLVAGVGRDAEIARQELEDRLLARRLDYDVALTQGIGGVIERREDAYPDANAYAQYAYQRAMGEASRPRPQEAATDPFPDYVSEWSTPSTMEVVTGTGTTPTPSYIDERRLLAPTSPRYPVYQWS